MTEHGYDALAGVYEFLVPEVLLTPEGNVAAFAGEVGSLERGARVLDCASGTGQLAVGLALRGCDVVATDASAAMVERTSALAAEHGAQVRTAVCRWEHLSAQSWLGDFDVVLCAGNSLTHAAGQAARCEALSQMRRVLRPEGILVVTSRNWELVRSRGSGLRVGDELVERGGRRALVVYGWTLSEGWDEPHRLDIAVALIDPGGGVVSVGERLTFWPFRHTTLEADLRSVGLAPMSTSYQADEEHYSVTARRSPSAR